MNSKEEHITIVSTERAAKLDYILKGSCIYKPLSGSEAQEADCKEECEA